MITSHVMSHEMGHVFTLYHTHHGTNNNEGDPNACLECVNGSNSYTCGDYIYDTPADPYIFLNVDPLNYLWTQTGYDSCIATNPQLYNPDELNIMSMTDPPCMDYVTPGQIHRVRLGLLSVDYLQAASSYTTLGTLPYRNISVLYQMSEDGIGLLDLSENLEGTYAYTISNYGGEIFREGIASNEIVEIDVAELSSGIYIIRVDSGDETVFKNFTII